MILLFLIALATMFIMLIPSRHTRLGLRNRSREEYELGMTATNWRPEHFYLHADGKYYNAYGEEGVCLTLSEMEERFKNDPHPT